jgi:methyl-accepting chemotaxis protein
MRREWTFGMKIGLGFALLALLTVAIGLVTVYALRTVVEAKDRVINVNAALLADAQELRTLVERKGGSSRGFMLTREERFVAEVEQTRREFAAVLARVRNLSDDRQTVDTIAQREADHQRAIDEVMALRRTEASIESVARAFEERVLPLRQQLDETVLAFVARETDILRDSAQASSDQASLASAVVTALAVAVVLCAVVIGALLTRALSRQIGSAVGQVQSSSTELQAAATQQATGAKQQATAMSEISTTISELLATSKQITESAQHVAQIADQTARAAEAGEEKIQSAHASIAGIRQQVDLVVGHMLELGKKSQQIGGVLDIVSELAEQTNILAINATIEAAGAGEYGRRFAVVADEIRKLADRVTGSTKEIRTLIEDVRGAVNTTVMATETGSKAVDAGSKHFGHVAASFKQIAGLVITTTEAAREIELSTKQQKSAVEQVNLAIANVAQASKETESSSTQTLQTASQLAYLSKDLLRLVQPQAA